MQRKYTREILAPVVASNVSIAGVIRSFGLRQAGGLHGHFKRLIVKFGLDTSHFLGQAANRGKDHKGGNAKKSPSEFLVLRSEFERRIAGSLLRRALIESGRIYICESCNQEPIWKGKSLLLVPDHKNGKFWDNRSENLKFLCPNCHSQTSTYCGRNNRPSAADETC